MQKLDDFEVTAYINLLPWRPFKTNIQRVRCSTQKRKIFRPPTTRFDEYLLFEWPFVFREKFVTLTPQTFKQQPRFFKTKNIEGGKYVKRRF